MPVLARAASACVCVVLVVRVAAVDDEVAGAPAGRRARATTRVGDRRRTGTMTQTTRSPAGSASTSSASDGDVGDVGVPVVPGDLDAARRAAGSRMFAPILPRPDQTDVHGVPLSSRPRLHSAAGRDACAGQLGEADRDQQVAVLRSCPRRRAYSWPVNSTGLFGCVNDSRTNVVLSAPSPSSRNCGLNATEMSSPTSVGLERLGRLRVVALAGVEDDLALGERQPDRGVALGDERDALGGVDQRRACRRSAWIGVSSGNSRRTAG